MEAAAYIRVSTEEQTEYSPDSQLRAIRSYAEAHGLRLKDEHLYLDEGISGRSAQRRPAFQRMVADARGKPAPFQIILVYSLSRFARSREDSVVYKRLLRKDLGIQVVSVTQELGEDKSAILLEALWEAMDEYYSIDLSENVRRGMQERLLQGRPVCAPPFGYQMEAGGWVPAQPQAEAVRQLFILAASGTSPGVLADFLNRRELRTQRGGPFTRRAVRQLLQNPSYLGLLRRGGGQPLLPGHHPALVDRETWDRVQTLLQREQPRRQRASPSSRDAWLGQGLLRCGSCGAPLVRAGKGRLQCSGYAHGKCVVSHSLSLLEWEGRLLRQIERDLPGLSLTLNPMLIEGTSATRRQRQLALERERLTRITAAYEAGVDSLEEYREKKARCLQAVQRLEASSSPSLPSVRILPLGELLTHPLLPAVVKNRFLSLLWERVDFQSQANTLIFHYWAL